MNTGLPPLETIKVTLYLKNIIKLKYDYVATKIGMFVFSLFIHILTNHVSLKGGIVANLQCFQICFQNIGFNVKFTTKIGSSGKFDLNYVKR